MGKSRGEEKELIGKEQRLQANAVELMRLSFETKCPQPVARQRETPNIQLISCKIDDVSQENWQGFVLFWN